MRPITSWTRNFRRWSTQILTAVGALAAYQGLPDVIAAATGSLPLWEPVLPGWAFALASMGLSMLGVWARNLPQGDIE